MFIKRSKKWKFKIWIRNTSSEVICLLVYEVYLTKLDLLETNIFINRTLDARTTPSSIRVGNDSTYSEMLIQLADAYSQNVYFDRVGNARFQNPPSQTNRSPRWHFTVEDNMLLQHNKTFDLENTYNAYQVFNKSNQNTALISGYSQDDDVLSPLYTGSIGIILAPSISNPYIQTQADADLYARYERIKNRNIYESVSISCVPIPILQEGDIVTLTNVKIGANRDRYIIQTIDYPLNFNGTMSLTLNRGNRRTRYYISTVGGGILCQI